MVDRAVVIFLFAQEKLLFRYPIHNPFHIDVNGGPARAQGKSPALALDTTTATATVTSNATTATAKTSAQQPQPKQPSTAAPAGVGVRKKRRNTMRSHPTPATAVAGEAADSKRFFDADGSGAVKAPHVGSTPSLVAHAAPHAEHAGGNGRRGGHSEAKEDDDTCAGVQTTVLVHLLRARFLSCTTIQFAGWTFLIYPLLPSNVKAQRLDADEPRRSCNFTADAGLVDMAHGNADDDNEDDEEGKVGKEDEDEEEGEGEGKKGKRAKVTNPSDAASQGIALVVAMNQPDNGNGVVANLVQVFMNVLVREELRSHYATEQVLRMERRMQAWDIGGDSNGNDGGLAKHDAPPCSGRGRRKRLSASDMFAELLKDAELSLCREISLLAQHITAVKHNSKTEDVVIPPRPSPVFGPSNLHRGGVGNNNNSGSSSSSSKSRNITGSGCCGNNNNSNGGGVSVAPNVSRATELVVRGLFTLPVAAILGRRRSAPYHASAYVKQNPNLIVTLEDPYFAERLAKPYVEAVGWRASQLLPLSCIFATLGSLSRPWRMGGLYRALERCLASALYQRQTMKQQQQQQQQQPQPQVALSTGSNSTARFGWIRTEESFTQEGGGNAFSLEDQNSRLDVDALIVEAVEFLRLSGALAIDDEITVVFTHGDLSPEAAGAARWPRKKKGGADLFCTFPPTTFSATHFFSQQDEALPKSSRQLPLSLVAPASMIGVLVFEGMRSSCGTALGGYGGGLGTPFFGADEVPDTPASLLKAAVKTSTSSTPSSPPVFSLPNTSGGDIPQFEVYCAWGNACPICEELASAPHAWRIGNSPICLLFPFLAPAIAEAAARRGRQGARLIDPECCQLMADQRPWFTRANAFTVPATQTEVSPVQKYRHLTRGCEDAAAQKVRDAAVKAGRGGSSVSRAESGGRTKQYIPTEDEKFTAITPGSTPVMVREWLAENRSVIEGRLADAVKQRQLLEEHTKQVTEKRAAAAAAAVEAPTAAACPNAGGSHSQQPHLPLASQRYHKRGFLSPGSVPGFAGLALPLSPTSLTPSHGSFSPLRPHHAVGDGQLVPTARMISAERLVPFEALMQFVFHHTVALLWGKPGIGVETLLYLLECNLRRLRPFLAHHTYLQQLLVTTGSNCATAAFSDTASCSSEQAVRSVSGQSVANSCNAFQVYPSCPPATSTQEQEEGRQQKGEGEEVLSSLEQQLLEAYTVFTELSLMDLLQQLHGMTVEVVPTRLLLHAVVNAFADVLLVGRGNGCSG
ncbi:hypothetical protein TRSC58_01884 [Trypanosoma rangeli SC58]|uniref:Uncharacterized protein n=1 Tax=Trypanosoma rangeli SC58 TaxID=429131 RepID=A0A061J7Q9_TRYRA|nr:hypothetical protein TRSC58_01884 [Trypanosoma rangeli SC58]